MKIDNMIIKIRLTLKKVAKPLLLMSVVFGALFVSSVFAAGPATLSAVTANVSKAATEIAKILSTVSLVAGIGFVMASFFKFHQHKNNPQQVSMSQGLSLLMIGAGLAVFPVIIPLASSTVFGSAKVSNVSGTSIATLIGGS
jgi:intracellular multiplication protein IcmD